MRFSISAETRTRILTMFALVFAGEMIYSLPFHLMRFFRPTVLEVFDLSNADLGDVFAPYGITAMLSYFPGGILADRFSARKMMCASLLFTAAGGFYLMTLPGMLGMSVLYAFWGVSSVFLFWCALIRATRAWGGRLAQGRGFGLLDGGRGLLAALFASAGVLLFSLRIGADPTLADPAERAAALQAVILFYTVLTLAAAAAVWRLIPETPTAARKRRRQTWSNVRNVLRIRAVWLQAVIVICAYCGFKGLDNYSLYYYEVLGMNETDAAGFAATTGYLRPGGAVLAGIVGDRFGIAWTTTVLFASLGACWGVLAFLGTSPELVLILYANLIVTVFGVYALRGLYFALLEQTHVPRAVTGTAIGVISLVGFTPDIFYNMIAGRLLDATPGIGGHQHTFLLLSGLATVGLIAAAMLHHSFGRSTGPNRSASPPR
ncbi:MAG: MFS transporter [Candidatus Aminicenantes bacterium]|nr:MFS transporter [Candidatus Aminicenantes bacterium]